MVSSNENSSLSPPVIAVVENDTLTLEFLNDMMVLWGYEVRAYANPAEALRDMESGSLRPDLLVVDLHLDEHGEGTDLIRQARGVAGLEALKAIVATGEVGFDPVSKSLYGVQVVTKPIRPDRFRETIRSHFAERVA